MITFNNLRPAAVFAGVLAVGAPSCVTTKGPASGVPLEQNGAASPAPAEEKPGLRESLLGALGKMVDDAGALADKAGDAIEGAGIGDALEHAAKGAEEKLRGLADQAEGAAEKAGETIEDGAGKVRRGVQGAAPRLQK